MNGDKYYYFHLTDEEIEIQKCYVNLTKNTQSLSSKFRIESKAQQRKMLDITIRNKDFYKIKSYLMFSWCDSVVVHLASLWTYLNSLKMT